MNALTKTARNLIAPAPSSQKAIIVPGGDQRPEPPIHSGMPYERYTQREAARHLEAYGGAEDAIDAVMNAARLIATTASSASYHFEKGGQKLHPERTEELPAYARLAPPDLVALLKHPNPWFDYVEMIELLMIDLLLVGNGYWLKFRPTEDGRPISLYRMHPPFVSIKPGTQNLIEAYDYKVPGKSVPLRFAPEDVIHFRLPNPHSPGSALGMGIIAGSPRAFDIELGLTETMAAFFQNGAVLSGVVQSERTVPDPIFQKVQRQFAYMFGGGKRAYQTAVLEKGLTYKPIQSSPRDAGMDTLSEKQRDRIYAMFGPGVQGLLAPSDLGKLADNQRLFDTKTMRPLLDKVQRKVSEGLTQAWGVDFKIDYDYIMPEEQRLTLAGDFASLPGVKVRQVLAKVGLPPTGDPQIDEMVLNLPGNNMGPSGEPVDANGNPLPPGSQPLADKPLGSEPGRPPKPESTAAFPRGAQARVPANASQKALREALRSGDRDALEDVIASMVAHARP